MNPTMKAELLRTLKLISVKLLSILLQYCFKFAFILNLRHYTPFDETACPCIAAGLDAWQGLHSSAFQLTLIRFCPIGSTWRAIMGTWPPLNVHLTTL